MHHVTREEVREEEEEVANHDGLVGGIFFLCIIQGLLKEF